MKLIKKHFPNLSAQQIEQFGKLQELYKEWNSQINVISRKDMELFYERHVLHSLGIAKVHSFQPGDEILDIGTGGGFPGIPLAILFPKCKFYLVDSIGKKIKVVQEVTVALGLKNVESQQIRAEELKRKFDFIVSRAVSHFDKFMPWTKGKFKANPKDRIGRKNGILYLKGGDLKEELKNVRNAEVFALDEYFADEFFETKKVVYVKNVK